MNHFIKTRTHYKIVGIKKERQQVFYLLSALETVPEIAVPVRLGIHGQNVGVACRLSERDLLPSPLSGK